MDAVPRTPPARCGQLDQLGGDGAGRHYTRSRRHCASRSRCAYPPATSATSSPPGWPAHQRRSPTSSSPPTPTTSSPVRQRRRHVDPAGGADVEPVDGHPGVVNFERLWFEFNGRDGYRTAEALASFREAASCRWTHALARVERRTVRAASFDDDAVAAEIARIHAATGCSSTTHGHRHGSGTGPGRGVRPSGRHDGHRSSGEVSRAGRRRHRRGAGAAAHLADLGRRPERMLRCANDLGAVEEPSPSQFG